MVLHLNIRDPRSSYDGRRLDKLTDGACSMRDLSELSFLQILGTEFIARSKPSELVHVCQTAFVLLANTLNDKAATQAFEATRDLMIPTYFSSPTEMHLSAYSFRVVRRKEEQKFFRWLESVFWILPHIKVAEVEYNHDSMFSFLDDRLMGTKSSIFDAVARIWIDGPRDTSAENAFLFLCDNCDSYRFGKKAEAASSALQKGGSAQTLKYVRVELSEKSREMTLARIRSALRTCDLEAVQSWGLFAQQHKVPDYIRKLIAHAYVNAGGNVFPVA